MSANPSATAAGTRVSIPTDRTRALADAPLADALAAQVPQRLTARDADLWGERAQPEARIRLGWVELPTTSRELLGRLGALRRELVAAGLDRVVLSGMGGSSLAPEVITGTAGLALTVLDTTDPHQVRRAMEDRLERTVVVVASKSGTTVETDSHRRAFGQAFREAGLTETEIAQRFVAVTDPGSPLAEIAERDGYRALFLADPHVGGRFSALSAFGLVPSALAGVDVEALLDEAQALTPSLAVAAAADNPGLLLGAVLGGAARAGRDKLVLADDGSGPAGFGHWAEQLIAESTGKDGAGILPVVVTDPVTVEETAASCAGTGDALVLALGESSAGDLAVGGPLGAQFLLWEYATAVAGRVLEINPFDQPNVAESKENTNRLLDAPGSAAASVDEPAFVDGPVEVHADKAVLDGAATLTDALSALAAHVPPSGYLAVMAYLDRYADSHVATVRRLLSARLAGRPVTFGWGPRFLHSTGQYHKGGPQLGAFLQITGAVTADLAIPGRDYTFGSLHLAQALGDLGALRERDRPVLRLHLRDRAEGIIALMEAAGS